MISGVTIIKNAEILSYPVVEAIRSALPICDEYIVVVGQSDDATLDMVQSIDDSRVRIVETHWSELVTPRHALLAQQTSIGMHMARGKWVICLQANEVLHESSLPRLEAMMKEYQDDKRVEALLLERLTFWGDYEHYFRAYPHRFKFSPRIVRPHIGTYSIRDAMSFAVFDGFSIKGRYPRALDTGENIYRYGFVRSSSELKTKAEVSVHNADTIFENHMYTKYPKAWLLPFEGSHPEVMKERVESYKSLRPLDDPAWRTAMSIKEKRRLLETRYYEHFGVPWFRTVRYKLLGSYLSKPRP